ncbi:MAG: hypothetical protein ACHP6H_07050, partial [Legionellales bacterium]
MAKHLITSILLVSFIVLMSCQEDLAKQPPNKMAVQNNLVLVETPILATHCPDDMAYIDGQNVCMDIYEAPNQKGVYPFYAQTAYRAEYYCSSIGKDLCTEERWHAACVGPENKLYSYSHTYVPHACNDDKTGWTTVPWLLMGTPAWDKWCKDHY